MIYLPKKDELLKNFSTCSNWEEKYMYIMDLGKLLPKFPKKMRIPEYSVTGCQSQTWIALTLSINDNHNNSVKFYGHSDSAIVKGIIVIIFSLYQEYSIQTIPYANIKPILINQLQLKQNLTISRSQGIYFILQTINTQSHNLLKQSHNKINQ